MISEARAGARLVDLAQVDLQSPLAPGERAELQDRLDVLTGHNASTNVPPSPDPIDGLIVSAAGRIIVSTDESMYPPGMRVAATNDALVTRLTERILELRGEPSGWGNPWVIDSRSGRTVIAYPLIETGDVSGVLTLAEPETEAIDAGNAELITGLITGNLFLLIFVTAASFVISIPVGIWTASRLSRRLTRLTEAAEAMGEGELEEPIEIPGDDEIARLGRRFNEMVEQVTGAEQQRRAFLANISHELRTPIAVIQGNLDQLLEDQKHTKDAPTLWIIRQEAVTLNRLIDDLFTLARLEEAQLPIIATNVDLHQLANQVVENLRAVAWQQSRVSVESLVSASIPQVRADRSRLRQILVNLLYNGIRHTPEGGMVVVQAEPRERDVLVSVRDTGVGIPEEELERVFDRFHQIERTGRHAEGSGLGLAIVKHLVEVQGGEIHVASTPGQGSTFTFSIPRAPTEHE